MTTGSSSFRWTGRALTLARLAWLVLAVPSIGLHLYSAVQGRSLAEALVSHGWTPEAYSMALAQLSWPVGSFDLLYSLATIVVRLSFVGVSLVLLRRASDGMALFTSLTLLTFSITAAGLSELPPGWLGLRAMVTFLQAFGQSCLFLFIFIFPNGRFVPSWTRWPTLAAIFALSVVGRLPTVRDTPLGAVTLWLATLWLLFSALPAQAYRYRRVSTPTERQQTKLVVFGIAVFLCGTAGSWLASIYIIPALWPAAELGLGTRARLLYDFSLIALQIIPALALPLALGIAVLRYRLWDIDLIIRRTLIYSVLTALLGLAYFGSVLVLQNVFQTLTGEGQNALATVLSTLTIAALFGPLRGRVQRAIDRRFFRQKYDAARTLAAFGAQARDVVALDQLTGELVAAVDATMQPAHVRLWVKPATKQQP